MYSVKCNDGIIYYRLKKEKGIPICKYSNSSKTYGIDYKIDISPRVDTFFFMLIAIEYIYHLTQTSMKSDNFTILI